MSNPLLLLWLESPIQSWGTRSRWDVRDTGLEPTKSGVIGLIGCALGLDRSDPELERLDRVLHFGVRVDRPGVVAADYHTVTGYHRTAEGKYKHDASTAKSYEKAQEHEEFTIVSPRDYLQDAIFLVALVVKTEHRAGNGDLLGRIRDCLQAPKWPLYLGRKSCVPSRPVLGRLTEEYQDIEAALRAEPLAETRPSGSRKTVEAGYPGKIEAWIECPDGEHERQDAMRLNPLRFYDFRRCRRIEIDGKSLGRRS